MSDPISRLNAALEGRYRIEREIGAGGMATVYLADDLRHERKVALKVLKPELAAVVGAERFLAEIKTTANLQHPNILPLHDSGEADGFLFYVMPYVAGESLRERLDREHQLPVDEAVRIAKDVAEALDYAHRQGVIHRDIKPANVLMLDGKPVVSDFGIALAVGAAGGGRLTDTGLSLGTPHYMSPEQATGDVHVGPATDVYALGCVLYEMLVGEPPYAGSTPQAILGKIITEPPAAVTKARKSVPPHVEATIAKALEKVPADRFISAQEFTRALADPGFRHGERVGAGGGQEGRRWNGLTIAFATTTAVISIIAGWALTRPPTSSQPEHTQVARFWLDAPSAPVRGVSISPDGATVVFPEPLTGAPDDRGLLWKRELNALNAEPVQGSEGMTVGSPAISPDGTEVAFMADRQLRVAPLGGGTVRVLADGVDGGSPSWGPDGFIYYDNYEIYRIPAQGGAPEAVTELSEGDVLHRDFRVLPDGRAAVFTSVRAPDVAEESPVRVEAIDLTTGERQVLTEGGSPIVTPTGHILFVSTEGQLLAAPIDAGTLDLGPTVAVVGALRAIRDALGYVHAQYDISESGMLVYAPDEGGGALDSEFIWVSRAGAITAVDPGEHFTSAGVALRIAPDDERVVFLQPGDDGFREVWVKELPDGPASRLTLHDNQVFRPFWTPNGETVIHFTGPSAENRNVWQVPGDGSGDPMLLYDFDRSFVQGSWSSDGDWLLLRSGVLVGRDITARDIFALRVGVDSVPMPLRETTEFVEHGPTLSPDSRWLAYSSNESGPPAVWIRPFPDADARRIRVSEDAGFAPIWAHSGTELFFVDGANQMIAAQVDPASGEVLGREILFTIPSNFRAVGPSNEFYDVTSDDQRFLFMRAYSRDTDVSTPRLVLVQNFFEELKRLVPN